MSAIDVDRIPAEIRALNRWVVWRYEQRPGNPKPTKVPYRPRSPRAKASSTDPSTWATFDEAVHVVNDGAADGIGFVLGDGWAGADFDDCILDSGEIEQEEIDPSTGEIKPGAAEFIRHLDSYTEISPSGAGLKSLVRGSKPRGRCKRGCTWESGRAGAIEMYDRGRFFTITGRHLEGTPTAIEDRTDALARVHAMVFPPATNGSQPPIPPEPLDLSDHELIDKALSAKNGAKFSALWNGDTSGYASHSDADLALCSLLAFWCQKDAGRMDRLFRSSGLIREKWDERRGEQTYRQLTIDRAIEGCREVYTPRRAPTSTSTSSDGDDYDRLEREAIQAENEGPTIRITADLVNVIDQALEAIGARPDLNVFVRARMLVTIERDGSMPETWLRRPPGEPVIVPIKTTYTREILARCAAWESVKKGRNGPTIEPCLPPMWVADHVLARMKWPLRYLDAVVEAPTLRTDGSILSAPGWDEQSALLYAPVPGARWPAVPDSPSADDVQRAVAALTDPVAEFPFVADSDRAAFVAAVLTIVARHCIDGPVPLFPVRAPTPGTGKTLLAEVIGLIGTGRLPAAMTLPYDGDELRKRITAIAIGGTPLVLIDNASGALGSDVLAAALTSGEWEDRVLGVNEMVRMPLRTVWIATGNNLAFRRTLGRRVVPIDMDAGIEQPEDRKGFRYPSLVSHVRAQRSRLVVAALTVLRAFFAAGRPAHGGTRMGSFEAWDDLIRSAVIWAGLADPASAEDPASGRGRVRAEADDDTEDLAGLLTALGRVFERGIGFTTASVLKRAEHDEDLRLMLDAACAPKKGGKATVTSVGASFRNYKNRPLNGLSLQRKDRTWFIHAEKRAA